MRRLVFAAILAISACNSGQQPNNVLQNLVPANDMEPAATNQPAVNIADSQSGTSRPQEICFVLQDIRQTTERQVQTILATLARIAPEIPGVRLRLHRPAEIQPTASQSEFFAPCDREARALRIAVSRDQATSSWIEREVNSRTGRRDSNPDF